jgi:hypothetical protein
MKVKRVFIIISMIVSFSLSGCDMFAQNTVLVTTNSTSELTSSPISATNVETTAEQQADTTTLPLTTLASEITTTPITTTMPLTTTSVITTGATTEVITTTEDQLTSVKFNDIYGVETQREFIDADKDINQVTTTYYVGYIENGVLDQLVAPVYNTGGVWLEVNQSSVSETSISTTVSESLAIAIGYDYVATFEVTVAFEKSVENAFSYAFESGSSVTFELDSYEKNTYYTILLVADYKIYQSFTTNLSTGEVTSIISAEIIGVPAFRLVSDASNDFSFSIVNGGYIMETDDLSLIFEQGDGTSYNPYCIYDETQLIGMFLALDKAFVLEDDIVLDKYTGGDSSSIFTGIFNGNNHIISGMEITLEAKALPGHEYYGFFSRCSGKIFDLEINDSSIKLESLGVDNFDNHAGSGYIYAGLLCGKAYDGSHLKNITISESDLHVDRYQAYTGGIVGYCESTLIEDSSVIDTNLFSTGHLGGITGRLSNASFIKGCSYIGTSYLYRNTLTYNGYQDGEVRYAGGLVGNCIKSAITESYVENIDVIYTGSTSVNSKIGLIVGLIDTGVLLLPEVYSINTNSIDAYGIADWTNVYHFNIDESITVSYEATSTGNQINWLEPETLVAGFDIYRATVSNGYYQKINSETIDSAVLHYIDNNILPGQTYYYKVSATNIPLFSNVVEVDTAIDFSMDYYIFADSFLHALNNYSVGIELEEDLNITSVTIFYRTIGSSVWDSGDMILDGNKYNHTIPMGYALDGDIEYYFIANDGITDILIRSETSPFKTEVYNNGVYGSKGGDLNGDRINDHEDLFIILLAYYNLYNPSVDEFTNISRYSLVITYDSLVSHIIYYEYGSIDNPY